MRVYVYQAALLCEDCGAAKRAELDRATPRAPVIEAIMRERGCSYSCAKEYENMYDSDDYPKGPYPDAGESDTPQHCDHCEVFLENPLTSDGLQYVKDMIAMDEERGGIRLQSHACTTWREFYGIEA